MLVYNYNYHFLQSFAEEGLLNIVGGCCGSTPAHIKSAIRCPASVIVTNSFLLLEP